MLSVGTIRFDIASVLEKMELGEVGGCTSQGDCAWRLLQLAVEKPWSVAGGLFVHFLAQMSIENAFFT